MNAVPPDRWPGAPRFMVDQMAIRLGKYLRILGYDAVWDAGATTRELAGRADVEDRILLTRNTRMPDQYPAPRRLLRLRSPDPVEQLGQVIDAFQLDTQRGLFSMCIRCNVALDEVTDKAAIRSGVHPNVYQRFDTFYTCPRCGTIFWKGSHVRNTCRKLGLPG